MEYSYDKEKLIDQIMAVYDPDYENQAKYQQLQKIVDQKVLKITMDKSPLQKLLADLQNDSLLITYDVSTNIIDQGHNDDGTLWVDLNIEIEDVDIFAKWLTAMTKNTATPKNQNEIEKVLRKYLQDHQIKFDDIGLAVTNYDVN